MSSIERFHCIQDSQLAPVVSSIGKCVCVCVCVCLCVCVCVCVRVCVCVEEGCLSPSAFVAPRPLPLPLCPSPQPMSAVSLFEFNIRFLGGLLSAYALTEDEVRGFPVSVCTHSPAVSHRWLHCRCSRPKQWTWQADSSPHSTHQQVFPVAQSS